MNLVRRPMLWYDPTSDRLMERGGWSYNGDVASTLWSLGPDGKGGGQWNIDSLSSEVQAYITTFGSAFASSNHEFYSLGGINQGSGSLAVQGLQTLNFSSNMWSDLTESAGYSVLAQATLSPDFGKLGVLVVLGGDSPPTSTYYYEEGRDLVEMSKITIYDPAQNSWYTQQAGGDVPPPRSEFCAVGIAAPDNSSYEM